MKVTEIYDNGADITVFLSDDDIAFALSKADEYQKKQGVGRDFRQAELSDSRSRGIWILGVFGELAVARALGIEWNGDITEDVGPYQVKAVDEPHLKLMLPSKGKHMQPDQIYISVAAADKTSLKVWVVRGWAYAGEVRVPEFEDDLNTPERQPAYALPNKLLRPMNTLPKQPIIAVE
jgi:hypothetical protein